MDSTQQTHTSNEATAGESSSRSVSAEDQGVKDGANRLTSHSKDSRNRNPVPPNVDHEPASSTPNIENSAVPKITDLPHNFRFIVTSRPLGDINDEFHGVQHIRLMSMDDIPPAVAEIDIRVYVSKELEGLGFQDREFAVLAEKADGLFEWARLACEYIKEPHPGIFPIDCYEAVVSRDPAERSMLLHDMYRLILTDIIHRDTSTNAQHSQKLCSTALARFRLIMGQILGTAEPLPLASLNDIRDHFPKQEDHFDVKLMVKCMGSLLSGTTNPDSPIRPLHASFHDFLTDESSSGEFFIDLSKAQQDLAFASLRVMEHGLRFNICGLKSSYLPNSEVPGLRERVQKCIPPHLSYSSRFWTSHVRATAFDKELAKEVKLLFDRERVFFWLESLALINALSGAVPALSLISQWLKGHSESKDISSTAMDVRRFIQVSGGMVLHSTPHLYLSALPFSPANSPLLRQFSARFPNTLRVAFGRDMNWPAVQTVLRGHTGEVRSVSFSPDGTRIVTGSLYSTVRLWDAATGQPVGEPLRGHTDLVSSVSFSPDGTRIVTGSYGKTVRLWGAVMRRPSPQRTESDHSAFSDEHPIMYPIETATTTTQNTWNNHTISFSSNSIHALRNTSELTEGASHDDRSLTPFFLNSDSGWVVGPKHRLLFWVPLASRHQFYNPWTVLVIPRGCPELDLSRMAHGQHWQKCREEP
ncbi:hypothetical protein BDR05DRAFT_963087 [Suillus weaverae]|nr:hypothetical protein BDR05DRAFT_963087 [Suillus weaverae]